MAAPLFIQNQLQKRRRWILAGLLMLFAIVLRRTAWVCDDSYITFRTVDNFIHGFGLRWNVLERVQSYTNPLWMFVVSGCYFFTREMFYTVIYLSLFVSLSMLGFYFFVLARTGFAAIAGGTLLFFSRAFIDYSTSGLENPLSHLLIALFLWIYFYGEPSNRRLFLLVLVASFCAVNRLDTILYFAPAILLCWYKNGFIRSYRAVIGGALPLILWTGFAVIYYGFPFPNTYYAKLHTGLPASAFIMQGLRYCAYSAVKDPVTVCAITAGIVFPLLRGGSKFFPLAAGLVLYILYVIKVGGDFMGGRFFSTGVVWSVILITQLPVRRCKTVWTAVAVCGIGVGLLSPYPPIISGHNYGIIKDDFPDHHGIADERAEYYPNTGLLTASGSIMPPFPSARDGLYHKVQGPHLTAYWTTGFFGYHAGPEVHIVDGFGLSDAFLARLPAYSDPDWRIGHFARRDPGGYVDTLRTKIRYRAQHAQSNNFTQYNQLADDNLAVYYNALCRITMGKIFSLQRFIEIIRMNFGLYDHLIPPVQTD